MPKRRRQKPRYLVSRPLASGLGWYHSPHQRDRKHWPVIRLSDDPATAVAEAQARNDAMDRWRAGISTTDDGPGRGTLPWLVDLYLASPACRRLAPRTRADYQSHLRVAAAPPMDRSLVAGWTPLVAARWIAKLPQIDGRLTRAGAYRASVVRALFAWAVEHGHCKTNPFQGLRLHPRKTTPPALWTWADEDTLLATPGLPTHLRRAVLLGVYTGQRVADVLAMTPTLLTTLPAVGDAPAQPAIWLRQHKGGAALAVPLHPRLIDELPTVGAVRWCTGPLGGSPDARRLNRALRPWLKRAGLAHLSPRGWRPSAVTRLADAGCTLHQIAAITGHRLAHCQAILERYGRATSTQARAAMAAYAAITPPPADEAARTN